MTDATQFWIDVPPDHPVKLFMSQGRPSDTPKPVMRLESVANATISSLQFHAKHVRLELLSGGEVRVTPS